MSVYKDNGVWHIYFRYKDITGKTHTIHRQSKKWKLKKDALAAEEHLKLQLTREYDDLTYSQLFNLYIEERTGKIKDGTIYELKLRSKKYIEPYFNKMSLITPIDIKKWQQYLISLNFSNKYIYKTQQLLKTVINFGIKFEYITYNPFKFDVAINKQKFQKEMLFWELEEWNKFISVVDDKMHHAYFSLLYWSGLRLGEALALKIKDVDLIAGTIKVNKTYSRQSKKLTTPKTLNSYRTVKLTESILYELGEIIISYRDLYGFSDNVYVFGYDTPLHPTTLRRRFYDYIALAKVKRIRIHDLRHSHVSLLRHLGFDRYEVAKRLGNTPQMIDSTYTHWFEKSQQEMVDKLNIAEKSTRFATDLQPKEKRTH